MGWGVCVRPEGWQLHEGLNIYPRGTGHIGGRIKMGKRILYARYSTFRHKIFVEYHSPKRDWMLVWPPTRM